MIELDEMVELKKKYLSNIVLFILLLFVIIYIIFNYNCIRRGEYFKGDIVKPILVTGILFLIIHMLITWDDDIEINEDDIKLVEENETLRESDKSIEIPKYKLGQNTNTNELKNEIIGSKLENNLNLNSSKNTIESTTRKYKVTNKLENNIFIRPNDNVISNQDIFINNKKIKYGLKFS